MKRILFIGKNISQPRTGGEICCLNQEKILKIVFKENFYKFSLPKQSRIKNLPQKLFFMFPRIQFNLYRAIAAEAEKIRPDLIYLETALYGPMAEYLKNIFPAICIVSYFHNIEIEYAKSYLSLLNPKSWYLYMTTKLNERKAILYSDKVFCITQKDSNSMKKIYGRTADFIMPFSIENKLTQSELNQLNTENSIRGTEALFVGSNFFGNTQGVRWFIKNVLPYTDIHLTIVGTGMEKAFKKYKNITVFDFVDSLDEFYKNADFVVLPIISGAGMKTKTAEAMMWGKLIIGTKNAFEGYECQDLPGIYCCETAEEFCDAIRKIRICNAKLFNIEIHNYFKEHFALQRIAEKVKVFFDGMDRN